MLGIYSGVVMAFDDAQTESSRTGRPREPAAMPLPSQDGQPSKRHMNSSSAPFRLLGTRNHEQDLLNGTANRKPIIQDENSGQPFTCGHSFVGIFSHGGAIVRQQDAVVFRGP